MKSVICKQFKYTTIGYSREDDKEAMNSRFLHVKIHEFNTVICYAYPIAR
jgi:hypothetical protein